MNMSIHRALAELKLLEKRIQRASAETFISNKTGDKSPKGFKSVDEFKEHAESSYKSAVSLIARRNAIKSAIVQSNASQDVKIAGKTYKVAEAIERKSSIVFEEQLLFSMKRQFKNAVDLFEREQSDFEKNLQKHLIDMYGSRDSKDEAEAIKSATEAFTKRNKVELIDPLSLSGKIKELEESIENFKMEVDFVLSESNSSTQIEIPETN